MDGKKLKAYYDVHGELIGTTSRELFADIPGTAQDDIRKRYNDYEVKEVIMFHDNQQNDSDMILYGSSFEDADNYFVRLEKGTKDIVLKVSPVGDASFYKQIK